MTSQRRAGVCCAVVAAGLGAWLAGGLSAAEDAGEPRVRSVCKASGRVLTMAVAPDGLTLAVGSTTNLVECFDPMTGKLRNSFDAHRSGTAQVAYVSGFPTWLVSVGAFDNTLGVWDPTRNKRRGTRPAPKLELDGLEIPEILGRVLRIAASPADEEIALAELVRGVGIWKSAADVDEGSIRGTEFCTGVAWSPDGRSLVTARPQIVDLPSELVLRARKDGAVRWSAQLAPSIRYIGVIGWVWPHIAFLSDASAVICGGERLDLGNTTGRFRSSARIACYEARDGRRRWLFEREAFVYSLAVAPDSSRVVAVVDAKVLVFDAATGRNEALAIPNPTPITVTFGPASDRVYIGCADAEILCVRLAKAAVVPGARPSASAATPEPATGSIDPGGAATTVCVSPDGAFVAVGRADGAISIHDAATGSRLRVLDGGAAPVRRAFFVGPDAAWLAVQGGDETVRLWDATTGRIRRDLGVPYPPAAVPAASPLPRFALAPNHDRRALTFDFQKYGSSRWDLESGDVDDGAVVAKGRTLSLSLTRGVEYATGLSDRGAIGQIVWLMRFDGRDLAWGDVCGAADADSAARAVTWREYVVAPSGDHSVVLGQSGGAGALRYFASRSGNRKWTRLGLAPVTDVAFRTGDESVYSATPSGVSVHAETDGAVLRTLDANGRSVTRIAFSPDGLRLFGCVAGASEVVRWDVAR